LQETDGKNEESMLEKDVSGAYSGIQHQMGELLIW
jgi:hypothetical protein